MNEARGLFGARRCNSPHSECHEHISFAHGSVVNMAQNSEMGKRHETAAWGVCVEIGEVGGSGGWGVGLGGQRGQEGRGEV